MYVANLERLKSAQIIISLDNKAIKCGRIGHLSRFCRSATRDQETSTTGRNNERTRSFRRSQTPSRGHHHRGRSEIPQNNNSSLTTSPPQLTPVSRLERARIPQNNNSSPSTSTTKLTPSPVSRLERVRSFFSTNRKIHL